MNQDPAILYVEDDPMSRRVMEFVLKYRMKLSNITMFEESSDFKARVGTLTPRPDVVFLDIHMKPYSGFEMLEILRNIEQYRHIPVVALTASVMNEEVAMMRTAGFDGCFAKPLDVDMFENNFVSILKGEQVWSIA